LNQAAETIAAKCNNNKKKSQLIYNKLLLNRAVGPGEKILQWKHDLKSDIEVETIIRSMERTRKACPSTKLQSFNYCFFNRNLSYAARLFHMKKEETPNCSICNTKESIYHLYWSCPDSIKLWDMVYLKLSEQLRMKLNWSEEECLLNTYNPELIKKDERTLLSLVTLIVKNYIHKMKCKNGNRSLKGLINEFKSIYNIEHYLATKNNRLNNFERKWSHFILD
jgi:hypothetical protein